jgi:[acyl-carrier-protein] S-malonyltransferase
MKIFGVFPGQGNQYKGMGQDLYENFPEVREMYDKACEITGRDLMEISFNSDQQSDPINLPLITYVHSCVVYDLLKEKIEFSGFAGHSVGEYAALYAAGVISYEQGLEIVKKRAEIMSKVSFSGSCLVAVRNISKIDMEEFLESYKGLEIALCNSPVWYVIGGLPKTIDEIFNKIPGRAIRLNVSVPSHTLHMYEAAEKFRDYLDTQEFNLPEGFTVYSNFSARQYAPTKQEVIDNLVNQICSTVCWDEEIKNIIMEQETLVFVEMGPKKSLARMIREIDPNTKTISIGNVDTLEHVIQELKQ